MFTGSVASCPPKPQKIRESSVAKKKAYPSLWLFRVYSIQLLNFVIFIVSFLFYCFHPWCPDGWPFGWVGGWREKNLSGLYLFPQSEGYRHLWCCLYIVDSLVVITVFSALFYESRERNLK